MNSESPSTTAAISVRNLRVVRGGREVIPDLSFEIPGGTVTGLLGPSGCGKSTVMRCLVGVQIVASGSVQVLGLPAGSPRLRSQIGYVTQAPAVYEDLTLAENLRYFAAVLGAPAGDAERVAGQVDLADRMGQIVGKMSGGQRARVSLATALLGKPEMLVLDEPTVGLDPLLRKELWQLFHELASSGVTLLVSSHVMDEAARCDRLLLMRDGHIIADDAPADLLAQTGASDIEAAFLRLVDPQAAA